MDTFWVITSYLTAFILLIVIPSARYYAETDEQKAFVKFFSVHLLNNSLEIQTLEHCYLYWYPLCLLRCVYRCGQQCFWIRKYSNHLTDIQTRRSCQFKQLSYQYRYSLQQ